MNLCCIVTTDDCIVYTHVYAGMLKQILVFVLNCLKHKNSIFWNENWVVFNRVIFHPVHLFCHRILSRLYIAYIMYTIKVFSVSYIYKN